MSKTSSGLIDYCKAQLGRPYWMGTFGQVATQSLYDYNKGRLPQYYTASDFPKQFGQRVHDCIGLIKGYLWSDGPDSEPQYCSAACPIDHDADNIFNACTEKGGISTMPDTPGAMVGMSAHIGVYIGGGQVIEARGHAYGVVRTALAERPWLHWGLCPYIEYRAPETVYNTIDEAPDWAKSTVQKLINKKYLQGDGGSLDLSDDMLRILVICDRAGAYGK
jgi:hypothetical protein